MKAYALPLMEAETRRGLMILSGLCFVLLGITALSSLLLSQGGPFTYTYSCLAALALHTFVSVRGTKGMAVHHMLGVTLLVISGMAVALLAFRTSELHPIMFATIALLFMVVPLVPWGLREASWVIGLVYLIFTGSTVSMVGGFTADALWALQFFLLSCVLISLVLVVRSVDIRKQDIAVRFALEGARSELETLANHDALTGALNRRALEPAFLKLKEHCRREGTDGWFCALDLDHFKELNDRYGHEVGDKALKRVVKYLQRVATPGEAVVRTGGDEFVLLFAGADPSARLQQVSADLKAISTRDGAVQIEFCVGLKRIAPDSRLGLDECYRMSDHALYVAKQGHDSNRIVMHDESLDHLPVSGNDQHNYRQQER